MGHSPCGGKELDTTEALDMLARMHARRRMAPALKSLELSEGFSKAFLKAGLEKKKSWGGGRQWGESLSVLDQLVHGCLTG